jgi:predicted DNA-binding transcriptional regulator AlpA
LTHLHFGSRDLKSRQQTEERDVSSAEEAGSEERNNLLTPDEVAAFFKISRSWLAKSRSRDDGPPFVKIGRSVRYSKGAVLDWALAHTKGSPHRETKKKQIRNQRHSICGLLLGERKEAALWISSTTKRRMTTKNLGSLISRTTKAEIGVDVSPHLFRTAAASTAATHLPALRGLAAGLLGHVDEAITEMHYNRAKTCGAAITYAELLSRMTSS